MKKITILLLMSFTSIISFGQNDEIKYKGLGMYAVFKSPTTYEVIGRVPYGKNCELTYNIFFKEWNIYFYDSDNQKNPFQLKYIQTNSDGSMLMQDFVKTKYIVINTINKNGKLIGIMDKTTKNGLIQVVEFDGIILDKQFE